MIVRCTECGAVIVVNGLGRKPLNISVNIIYDALRASSTVTEAAKKLSCSRGYVYRILKEHGISPKELTKGRHSVKKTGDY
jgi:excisionase family DNA binding protein